MNEILNRNMKFLEKFQPNTYNKLSEFTQGRYKPKNNEIDRIVLAKQDDFVINMLLHIHQKEYLLFDHEDPIGQAYDWIDKFIDPSNKAEIVFGMGFGFHIEVLLSSFKNKKVFLIEPNMELFYQVLKVRNLEQIIEKSKIYVDEDVQTILNDIYTFYWDSGEGGIQCQPFEVYSEIFEDVWNELREKLIKQAQSFNVDLATRRISGELWIHNYISNSFKMADSADMTGMVGKFKGMAGILVSAGPSLGKNMHLLKDLKDKCIILAGGTAVNILECNGISPHFMMGIDAWQQEAEIHKKVKSDEIFFIYSNQVTPCSIDSYKGSKFFMNYSADTYTLELLKSMGINSEVFYSGPSVSNTCFDVLFKMGCNPIILIGQDLGFTGGSNYAGDVPESEFKNVRNPEEKGYISTEDIHGTQMYTNMAYLSIKNFFEGYFERVKDKVEIINATEGGLNINFARNDTLENVISTYHFQSYDISGEIKEIHENSRFPKDIAEKLEQYNNSILEEIEQLEEYSKKQLKLVDLIKRDVYHPAKDKKAFDKMVGRIAEFTDLVIASPIYHSILKNLLEIDFYLLKVEVERATKVLQNYNEIKAVYINALLEQNKILSDKLAKVRSYLEKSEHE